MITQLTADNHITHNARTIGFFHLENQQVLQAEGVALDAQAEP